MNQETFLLVLIISALVAISVAAPPCKTKRSVIDTGNFNGKYYSAYIKPQNEIAKYTVRKSEPNRKETSYSESEQLNDFLKLKNTANEAYLLKVLENGNVAEQYDLPEQDNFDNYPGQLDPNEEAVKVRADRENLKKETKVKRVNPIEPQTTIEKIEYHVNENDPNQESRSKITSSSTPLSFIQSDKTEIVNQETQARTESDADKTYYESSKIHTEALEPQTKVQDNKLLSESSTVVVHADSSDGSQSNARNSDGLNTKVEKYESSQTEIMQKVPVSETHSTETKVSPTSLTESQKKIYKTENLEYETNNNGPSTITKSDSASETNSKTESSNINPETQTLTSRQQDTKIYTSTSSDQGVNNSSSQLKEMQSNIVNTNVSKSQNYDDHNKELESPTKVQDKKLSESSTTLSRVNSSESKKGANDSDNSKSKIESYEDKLPKVQSSEQASTDTKTVNLTQSQTKANQIEKVVSQSNEDQSSTSVKNAIASESDSKNYNSKAPLSSPQSNNAETVNQETQTTFQQNVNNIPSTSSQVHTTDEDSDTPKLQNYVVRKEVSESKTTVRDYQQPGSPTITSNADSSKSQTNVQYSDDSKTKVDNSNSNQTKSLQVLSTSESPNIETKASQITVFETKAKTEQDENLSNEKTSDMAVKYITVSEPNSKINSSYVSSSSTQSNESTQTKTIQKVPNLETQEIEKKVIPTNSTELSTKTYKIENVESRSNNSGPDLTPESIAPDELNSKAENTNTSVSSKQSTTTNQGTQVLTSQQNEPITKVQDTKISNSSTIVSQSNSSESPAKGNYSDEPKSEIEKYESTQTKTVQKVHSPDSLSNEPKVSPINLTESQTETYKVDKVENVESQTNENDSNTMSKYVISAKPNSEINSSDGSTLTTQTSNTKGETQIVISEQKDTKILENGVNKDSSTPSDTTNVDNSNVSKSQNYVVRNEQTELKTHDTNSSESLAKGNYSDEQKSKIEEHKSNQTGTTEKATTSETPIIETKKYQTKNVESRVNMSSSNTIGEDSQTSESNTRIHDSESQLSSSQSNNTKVIYQETENLEKFKIFIEKYESLLSELKAIEKQCQYLPSIESQIKLNYTELFKPRKMCECPTTEPKIDSKQ